MFAHMKTKLYPIHKLIPAEYNPRKLSDEQRAHIRTSLQQFGFVQPVVVNTHPNRKNVIVGGHQKVTVAKEDLGYTEVPCFEVNLPLEQERELNIRLNKNQGEWDWAKLEELFSTDELITWGFETFNFGMHNETIPVPQYDAHGDEVTQHVSFDATRTEREEQVVFECFMLPADRKRLTNILNTIKAKHGYERTADALNHLTTFCEAHHDSIAVLIVALNYHRRK